MLSLKPQAGKQEQFLSSTADIVIYGGAAGGGKTIALLLEAYRHTHNKDFGAVIFRSTLKQVMNEGGLWDEASKIYLQMDATAQIGHYRFLFPSGAKVGFGYLQRDDDTLSWQGSQIALIGFDELTHFSKQMFFYMLSRNRSGCGVRPYVRATTNPDTDSWVREFIDWWIDEDGYPIEPRSGIIRYFINDSGAIFWADEPEELKKKFPDSEPKSFTFISANVYDNKILLENDPSYLGNLKALNTIDKERLLNGNWNVRATAGSYFKKNYFEVVDAVPQYRKIARCWDFASTVPSETNKDPDWTVGLKGLIAEDGIIYVTDMERYRESPAKTEIRFKNTGSQDGRSVKIKIPQDPGSAGKVVAHNYIKMMRGHTIEANTVSGSKELRASPASAQAEIGNIKILRGDWNKEFLGELENFPDGIHDDIVDTLSDLIDELTVSDIKVSTTRIRGL